MNRDIVNYDVSSCSKCSAKAQSKMFTLLELGMLTENSTTSLVAEISVTATELTGDGLFTQARLTHKATLGIKRHYKLDSLDRNDKLWNFKTTILTSFSTISKGLLS